MYLRYNSIPATTSAPLKKYFGTYFIAALPLHMATRNNSTLSQSDYKRFFGEGLTFDDVLLMPAYSQVLPREVNIQTQLTKSLSINIPMLSAAMDTVTEASLAIALAREGALAYCTRT